MEFDIVEVESRDHYKGAQEPISFRWLGKEYRIEQILDRWYEGHVDSTRMPLLYFKVKTETGEVFILRYHEFFRRWAISSKILDS